MTGVNAHTANPELNALLAGIGEERAHSRDADVARSGRKIHIKVAGLVIWHTSRDHASRTVR
jgi:hypothetical protein